MSVRDRFFWEIFYDSIIANLGFDRERDHYSCRILDIILSTRMELVFESRRYLSKLLEGGDAIVVGDAFTSGCPSKSGKVLIAADAAFGVCLREGIIPDVVVTDLDGITRDMLGYRDVVYVVHAHGDNIDKIVSLVPEVRGFLIGTAQCGCSHRVDVPGGFTDGDRGVYLAFSYGASRVYLYGFDFGRVSRLEKPSGTLINIKNKLAKLAWAKLLLQLLKYSGYRIECLEGGCKSWI